MTEIILLIVGVPAVAITILTFAICKKSGQCSLEEERELDELCCCAVEGALSEFHPKVA